MSFLRRGERRCIDSTGLVQRRGQRDRAIRPLFSYRTDRCIIIRIHANAVLEWKIGITWHDAMASVRGRHRGRLGALLVATPNGTTFSVGTGLTDAQREHPPAVGALITFRFQELTDRGVPRFPSFVRTGSDVAAAC